MNWVLVQKASEPMNRLSNEDEKWIREIINRGSLLNPNAAVALLAEIDQLRELNCELLEGCNLVLDLFAKDHAIDRFNWGDSFLRA